MTWIPASAEKVLSGTPIAGSIEQINAIAAFLRDVADDARDFLGAAQRASLGLYGITSSAVTTLDAKLAGTLIPGSAALRDSSEDAKRHVDAYAAEIDRVHREAVGARNLIDDRLASIRIQARTIESIAADIGVRVAYAWDAGAPGQIPEPRLGSRADDLSPAERAAALDTLRVAHEHQWFQAAMIWHSDIDDIASARAKWARLIEDRRAAERRLVAGLGETVIGQLITLGTGGGASRKRTIALGISGELWGAREIPRSLPTEHPLLEKLIGRADGSDIWGSPGDPAAIAERWAGLSEAEQDTLIAAVPWVIGNLPGLPYSVRDRANRNQLEFYRQHPQLLNPEQLRLMAEVQRIVEREAGQIAARGAGTPPIQLVALDPVDAPPKVAVGYGDLDSATHTTWAVPGMDSDAANGLSGMDKSSRNLHKAQSDLSGFSGRSTAVVAWLGYDTPDLPPGDWGVFGSEYALAAAPRFAAELDGQFAARSAGNQGVPVTNVLAHSYGTTVVTIALTTVAQPVDALVMLGSAGLDTGVVGTLDDLRVKEVSPGQRAIYTTHASGDRIAPVGAGLAGRGQPNPGATALGGLQNFSPVYGGALSFSAEGDRAQGLLATNGHSLIGEGGKTGFQGASAAAGQGYMDRNTQALDTAAKITTGLIDERLAASFTRTEAQRVETVVDPQSGIALPRRVEVGG